MAGAARALGAGRIKHLSTGTVSILRLHPGDPVTGAIEDALRETYTRNAIVEFGIGSLSSAEFGVLPAKGPHKRVQVEGPVELVSLGGLIVGAGSGGPYAPHLHIAIAGHDGIVKGGHLFSATVGAAAEVGLLPLHDSRLRRVRDDQRELDLLEF